MLRRTEREVYRYDLAVRSRARHAPLPALSALVSAWQAQLAAGEVTLERDKGTLLYRIGEIAIDQQRDLMTLLIRRGDTNASNAVYSHRETGVSRVAEREDDEVGDKAAHLVISLVEETNKPNRYLAHLEGVPGLSHRIVQALLNKILAAASKTHRATFD